MRENAERMERVISALRAAGVAERGDEVDVRYNFHTLSHRYKTDFAYFGMSRYVIDFGGAQPRIVDKYVVLKNDYINQVIDVYHI